MGKRVIRYGAIVVGVVALAAGGVALWLASDAGRGWVASELSSALDSADIDINVASIDGSLFSEFTLGDVTATDESGMFLNAPSVTINWSPLALLRGTVQVSSLSSDVIELARLPETEPREKAEASSAGLPVEINIQQADLSISFENTPYQAAAEKLSISKNEVRGRLSVANADLSDVAAASVTWSDMREGFALNGSVKAKSGGLITGLLGLESGDSLEADITATGTVDVWQGTIKASIPQKLALDGEAAGADGVWQGSLNFQGGAYVPTDLKELVADTARVEFKLTPEGKVRNGRLEFEVSGTSGDLGVEAQGEGALDGGLQLRGVAFKLESPQATVASLTADDVHIVGAFNYEGGELALDYQARASHLAQGTVAVRQLDAAGTLQVQGNASSGAIERARFVLEATDVHPTPITSLSGQWSYALTERALSLRAVALEGDGIIGREIAVEYGPDGLKTATGQLEAHAEFLSPWVGNTLVSGALKAAMSSQAAEGGLLLMADLAGSELEFNDPNLQALVGAAPSGATELFLPHTRDEDIRLTAGRLVAAGFETRLNGTYSRATGEVDFSAKGKVGREGQLGLDAVTLSGEAVFEARFAGTLNAPSLTLTAGIDAFEGYGVSLDKPQLNVSVTPDAGRAGRWTGTLQFEGGTPLGPTTLEGDIKASRASASLEDITLSAPGAAAQGSISWSRDTGLDGTLQGSLQAIEDQSFDLKGNALLSVQLKSRDRAGDIAAKFDAEDITFLRQGRFPATLAKANGQFSFGWGDGPVSYQASFTGQKLNYGAQSLDVISVQGDSASGDPLLAELSGYWGSRFTLSARATPVEHGVDAEFIATYGAVTTTTNAPITVRWPTGQGVAVQAEDLAFADGKVSASVIIKEQVTTARIKLENGDFTAINLLQPGVLETGRVSVELVFDRDAAGEKGQVQMQFSDVTLPQWRVAAAPDVYAGLVTAKLSEGALVLDGTISEAGREFGQLTGNLPYQRKESGTGYEIRPNAPLALDLTWRGDVAPVWLLARRPNHLLTGTLDGSLSLSGDLGNPTFKGRLDLADGRYEYEPLGLVAEIGELQVEGTQDRIELTSLKASDGNGGTLTGRGEFELSRALSFPGTLTVEMTDFRVARLDELGGTASASLVYQRAEELSTLTGQITTGKMQVAMPRELPRSVVEIDVIEINGEEEHSVAQAQALARRSKPTQLAISVDVPGQFFFEGRGLQSEWEGDLLLGGTSDEPEVSGTMLVKNGVFNFGSKAFEIVDGRLMFMGTARLDPDIVVTAIHKTASIEAQLQITGPASAPKIELSSIPDMPDDEIMARVLLGKSVSDLTALQLAELVGAMDTLRGGGSLDVVGRLRRGLGLDTLSLNRDADDDDGATTITGGKYLRKNIYLEVETSTVSSETATRLKIDIGKNLLAETELGARQGSSLKLKWFWEY